MSELTGSQTSRPDQETVGLQPAVPVIELVPGAEYRDPDVVGGGELDSLHHLGLVLGYHHKESFVAVCTPAHAWFDSSVVCCRF